MLFALTTLLFLSCHKPIDKEENLKQKMDTLMVVEKSERVYEQEIYDLVQNVDYPILKTYTYYWVVGKDTLDFSINVSEEGDGTIIYVYRFNKSGDAYRKRMSIYFLLKKIKEIMPSLKEGKFDMNRLYAISFEDPSVFTDLSNELSNAYQKYPKGSFHREKLNELMQNTKFHKELNHLLSPWDKKVAHYSIEKLHIIGRKQMQDNFIEIDTTKIPQDIIAGNGFYINVKNNQP